MAAPDSDSGGRAPAGPLTPLRIGLIGLAVLAVAFAAYWFLVRTTYAPVLQSLAPEDAADVVKILDEKKIAYRLADGGTAIQVPSDLADKARIELVASELPMRGQVGFELFNQSDMGLTEFAQKINYQRALQGELARTILMLDGIHSVRVHLGLAERSLFRDETNRPKASITLVLKPGTVFTEKRVDGIQRLAAGAVPDLAAEDVAVLDETGKIISRPDEVPTTPMTASEARMQLHRANIFTALRRIDPDLRVGVTVSPQLAAASPPVARDSAEEGPADDARKAPAGEAIRVTIATASPLDEAKQQDFTRAIRNGVALDPARVAVNFVVSDPGLLSPMTMPSAAAPSADPVVAKSTRGSHAAVPASGLSWWWLLLPLGILAIAGAIWSDRVRRQRHREQLVSFTRQLREGLAVSPEVAA